MRRTTHTHTHTPEGIHWSFSLCLTTHPEHLCRSANVFLWWLVVDVVIAAEPSPSPRITTRVFSVKLVPKRCLQSCFEQSIAFVISLTDWISGFLLAVVLVLLWSLLLLLFMFVGLFSQSLSFGECCCWWVIQFLFLLQVSFNCPRLSKLVLRELEFVSGRRWIWWW